MLSWQSDPLPPGLDRTAGGSYTTYFGSLAEFDWNTVLSSWHWKYPNGRSLEQERKGGEPSVEDLGSTEEHPREQDHIAEDSSRKPEEAAPEGDLDAERLSLEGTYHIVTEPQQRQAAPSAMMAEAGTQEDGNEAAATWSAALEWDDELGSHQEQLEDAAETGPRELSELVYGARAGLDTAASELLEEQEDHCPLQQREEQLEEDSSIATMWLQLQHHQDEAHPAALPMTADQPHQQEGNRQSPELSPIRTAGADDVTAFAILWEEEGGQSPGSWLVDSSMSQSQSNSELGSGSSNDLSILIFGSSGTSFVLDDTSSIDMDSFESREHSSHDDPNEDSDTSIMAMTMNPPVIDRVGSRDEDHSRPAEEGPGTVGVDEHPEKDVHHDSGFNGNDHRAEQQDNINATEAFQSEAEKLLCDLSAREKELKVAVDTRRALQRQLKAAKAELSKEQAADAAAAIAAAEREEVEADDAELEAECAAVVRKAAADAMVTCSHDLAAVLAYVRAQLLGVSFIDACEVLLEPFPRELSAEERRLLEDLSQAGSTLNANEVPAAAAVAVANVMQSNLHSLRSIMNKEHADRHA